MTVIIRLQNLPWTANALDIRRFFQGLAIPDGGVHIVGGEKGDAFIAFSTDDDARQAMYMDNNRINDNAVKLLLSSKTEMQNVIAVARGSTSGGPGMNEFNRPNQGPGVGGPPQGQQGGVGPQGMGNQSHGGMNQDMGFPSGGQFENRGMGGVPGRMGQNRMEGGQNRLGGGPDRMGGGPERMGGGPDRMGGGPDRMGGGPDRMGGGPDRMGGGPDRMGGGPDRMGGGPDRMGGGPDRMGGGPNTDRMGGGPDRMGGGPDRMVGGPDRMGGGPNTDRIGGGPGRMGGGPDRMGAGPVPDSMAGGPDRMGGGPHHDRSGRGTNRMGGFDHMGGNDSVRRDHDRIGGQDHSGGPNRMGGQDSMGGPGHMGDRDFMSGPDRMEGNDRSAGFDQMGDSDVDRNRMGGGTDHFENRRDFGGPGSDRFDRRESFNNNRFRDQGQGNYGGDDRVNQESVDRRSNFGNNQFNEHRDHDQGNRGNWDNWEKGQDDNFRGDEQQLRGFGDDNRDIGFNGGFDSDARDKFRNDNFGSDSRHVEYDREHFDEFGRNEPMYDREESFDKGMDTQDYGRPNDFERGSMNFNNDGMNRGNMEGMQSQRDMNFDRDNFGGGPNRENESFDGGFNGSRMNRGGFNRNDSFRGRRGSFQGKAGGFDSRKYSRNTEYFAFISNMPTNVSYKDVRRFFSGCEIPRDGLKLINDKHGKRVGTAYVMFTSEADCLEALKREGHTMGNKRAHVDRCSQHEFESSVDSFVPGFGNREYSTPGGPFKRNRSRSPLTRSHTDTGSNCLLMKNVHFRATKSDISKFFAHITFHPSGGPFIDIGKDGRPSGNAYVEMGGKQPFQEAMKLKGKFIMGRPIDLVPITKKEFESSTQSYRKDDTMRSTGDKKHTEVKEDREKKETKASDDTDVKEDEKKFYCIKMKGLPFQANVTTIREFFEGLEIAKRGIHIILNNQGQAAGAAFVEFVTSVDCKKALVKDKQYIGKRYIDISTITKKDMLEELKGEQERHAVGGSSSKADVPTSMPGCTVTMANLPFKVQLEDIMHFFNSYHPIQDTVRLRYSKEGKPTGDAMVVFQSPRDAQKAVRELGRKMMMGRAVMLSQSQ